MPGQSQARVEILPVRRLVKYYPVLDAITELRPVMRLPGVQGAHPLARDILRMQSITGYFPSIDKLYRYGYNNGSIIPGTAIWRGEV